jgi:hypothetical protein
MFSCVLLLGLKSFIIAFDVDFIQSPVDKSRSNQDIVTGYLNRLSIQRNSTALNVLRKRWTAAIQINNIHHKWQVGLAEGQFQVGFFFVAHGLVSTQADIKV